MKNIGNREISNSSRSKSYSNIWKEHIKNINQNNMIIKLKKIFIRLDSYNKNLSDIKLILLMTFVFLWAGLLAAPFLILLPAPNNFNNLIDMSNYRHVFIEVVILGPLQETIIAQFLIISILRHIKFIKKYRGLQILISALFFSIPHYNWGGIGKVVLTFYGGLILAYSFTLYSDKKIKPILIVFTIHALYNFIVTIGLSMLIRMFI